MDSICYNAEAYQRWLTFPGNKNPARLYVDGHRNAGEYWTYEDTIVNRMNKPATMTIRLSGSYSPGKGSGSITAVYRNDSSATIIGRVMFVLTEDSVYYMDSLAGKKKEWHNHTPRDYIPGPSGTIFTIPAGDSVIYTQPFTINLPVRYQYCSIVTYIQDTVLRPDTVTRIMYQGSKVKVTSLIGVVEESGADGVRIAVSRPMPTPCAGQTSIKFNLPPSSDYKICIFDVAGRLITAKTGVSSGQEETFTWKCRDLKDRPVSAGVYLYRLESRALEATGAIVVR